MDSFLGIVVMVVIMIIGGAVLWKSIDSRYPKTKIDVRDRGTRAIKWFRMRGDRSIVKDDLIAILLNKFVYYGDLDTLTYHIQPNGTRIYDAYMRYDYLCAVKMDEKTEPEILESRPIVYMPKGAKSDAYSITLGEFIMTPIKLKLGNEQMTERTVRTGKDIAIGFIEAEEASKAYNTANNPIMAALIGSIPLLIIAGFSCLMLYIAYTALNDNVLKMLEAAATIAASTR